MEEVTGILSKKRRRDIARVRVGIVPTMLYSRPAATIRQFKALHPDTNVDVRSVVTTALIDDLEQGHVDVAICLTNPPLKGISSFELFTEEYLLCLPEGHRLAQQDEVSFTDLRYERIMHGPRSANPQGFDGIVAACMGAGFSPHITGVIGSYLDQAALVSVGLGVSLMPISISAMRPSGVVYRPIATPSAGFTASISWFDRRIDSVGRAFIRYFRSEYSTTDIAEPHPAEDQ
jgi:DNA-binding transcriptional LysR family regulator